MSGLHLVIAGGGTGGHVFPAVAIAEAAAKGDAFDEVRFIGSSTGLEAKVVPASGFPISFIDVAGLKRVSTLNRLRSLAKLPLAIARSAHLLRQARADVVVGVGGYVSGPVLLAAKALGLPTAICEQNSVPGFTNRSLSKFVNICFTAFEGAAAHFPERKVRLLGNPVRANIGAQKDGVNDVDDNPLLVVLGGSQGARPLNQAMPTVASELADFGLKLRVVHQAGRAEAKSVVEAYAKAGVDADVHAFIDDMGELYRCADVVVCRAGATTCAELLVAQACALLVPFPFAADDHQTANARELERAGAAILVPQDELSAVGRLLKELLSNSARRGEIRQKAGALAKPNAAHDVVDALVELAANSTKRRAA